MFALAYGVLYRPFAYSHVDRLVLISTARPLDGSDLGVPFAEVAEWQRRLTTVNSTAAYTRSEFTVRGAGDPEVLAAAVVTSEFFRVLGTQPERGVVVLDETGPPHLVVSARYARRLAASGPVIGRRVTVGTVSMDVAAVMPEAFTFPGAAPGDIDLWVPAPAVTAVTVFNVRDDRRAFRLVARLQEGATVDQALEDAKTTLQAVAPGKGGRDATVRRLSDAIVGQARPVVLALSAAGALLLLVACANVATLLISRTLARSREFAVRLAIGSGTGRLVRSSLIETGLVVLAGSALGIALAEAALRAFLQLASGSVLPRPDAVRIDVIVILASIAVAAFVTILCGLAPALTARRSDLASVLRRTAATTTPRGRRLRGALVIGQLALTVVMLTVAGLLGRTVWLLLATDVGATLANTLTLRLSLTETRSFNAATRGQFVDELLRRVRALPGVQAAGVGSNLPPRVNQIEMTVRFLDEQRGRDETHGMNMVGATPGYLEALGVRIVEGRTFEPRDIEAGQPVAVVSRTLARQLAPNRSVLNQTLGRRSTTARARRDSHHPGHRSVHADPCRAHARRGNEPGGRGPGVAPAAHRGVGDPRRRRGLDGVGRRARAVGRRTTA